MKLKYDFHLHSCLSPCAEEEMTPYNLVNMAKILELDVIALTDHNTTGNCAAAIKAGEGCGLVVIPGMELCTAEEIHIVCLFPALEKAEAFGEYIKSTLPPVKNKPKLFGRQLYMDELDNILGEEETLLITASSVSVDETPKLCAKYGGICYPAHIDRESFSIISSLGVLPHELGFQAVEISRKADLKEFFAKHPDVLKLRIIRSSDAHNLEDMWEGIDLIEVFENSPTAVIEYFKNLLPQN